VLALKKINLTSQVWKFMMDVTSLPRLAVFKLDCISPACRTKLNLPEYVENRLFICNFQLIKKVKSIKDLKVMGGIVYDS
jgi:hypothetical protein